MNTMEGTRMEQRILEFMRENGIAVLGAWRTIWAASVCGRTPSTTAKWTPTRERIRKPLSRGGPMWQITWMNI
mgnify:CR=1 FL=1